MYRTKPVEVEARQFTGGSTNAAGLVAWLDGAQVKAAWMPQLDRYTMDGVTFGEVPEVLSIFTPEGTITASVGDWVIRDWKTPARFSIMSQPRFVTSYEEVNGNGVSAP